MTKHNYAHKTATSPSQVHVEKGGHGKGYVFCFVFSARKAAATCCVTAEFAILIGRNYHLN